MTAQNHQDLAIVADEAFKAWFRDPSDRELERNYWNACEAVRKSSMSMVKQSLNTTKIHEIVTPEVYS